MFYRVVLSFFAYSICVYLRIQAAPADENTNVAQDTINVNDTILQFFYNCTCVPFFQCSEANRFTIAAKAGVLTQELYCSNKDFMCCKVTQGIEIDTSTEVIKPSESTTVKPIERTTESEIPSIRGVRPIQVTCGIAKTQISQRILTPDTESAATIPGEVPWMVEIFQKRNNQQRPYRFKCAGTLLHPKVVLTGTHCVVSALSNPKSLKIIATGREVFQDIGKDPDDERNVERIIKHPEFYSGGLFNDISLLILQEPYDYTTGYLNSICLPKANESFEGRRCLASGWGQSMDNKKLPLSKVDLPVVNFTHCQNLLRKTHLGPEFKLDCSFMCAGGEQGKDTCKGDGGGPLMCLGDEYQFVQAGIVSWGAENKCGVVDLPGVYADVGKFTEWIKSELMKLDIKLV